MHHLPAFLAYVSYCLAAAAAAATVTPAPLPDGAGTETVRRVDAAPADAAPAIVAIRLSQRVEIEAALAQGRAPVPLLRQAPPPYVAAEVSQPSVVAPKAEPSAKAEPSVKADLSAKAKIEEDGYRSVRMLERGADGKWRGRALRGQTEVAVLVDEQGNVSSQ